MAKGLNNRAVDGARHPGGHKRPVRYPDSAGLFLQVTPSGAKSWIYRFSLDGRAREMGLGSYEDVSLAKARLARDSARASHRQGIDPIADRASRDQAAREARLRAEAHTFKVVANELMDAKEAGWRNPVHRRQWRSTLETYAYPIIGHLPVGTIDTDAVLRVLKPIWSEKPETASRIRGRIERVLSYAKSRGLRSGDNPATWRGHLSESLPSPKHIDGAEPGHYPALPWKRVGAFVKAVRAINSFPARALELLIFTACRTNEVLAARWAEIDLEAAVWTVPAPHTKSKREHRVPLSLPAVAVLKVVLPLRTCDDSYVFPGRSAGARLSSMALLMTLRRMNEVPDGQLPPWRDGRSGLPATPHGFRSTFRDWVGEATPWPTDLAEAALAHVISDKTVAAYARGELFDKRVLLMADWTRHCTESCLD